VSDGSGLDQYALVTYFDSDKLVSVLFIHVFEFFGIAFQSFQLSFQRAKLSRPLMILKKERERRVKKMLKSSG